MNNETFEFTNKGLIMCWEVSGQYEKMNVKMVCITTALNDKYNNKFNINFYSSNKPDISLSKSIDILSKKYYNQLKKSKTLKSAKKVGKSILKLFNLFIIRNIV